MRSQQDAVARYVEQWAAVRPELDASPMLVIGRITRLRDVLHAALRPPFAARGLGDGEFDILAALRRADAALSPGDLARQTMVTTGATTKRLDRLEAAGLISRTTSDADARVRTIALTPAGRALVDDAAEAHFANEARLLAGLSPRQRETLAHALGTWLAAIEADGLPADPGAESAGG